MECPRCGNESFEEYSLSGNRAVVCQRCGYVGVSVEHESGFEEFESWNDAVKRFKDEEPETPPGAVIEKGEAVEIDFMKETDEDDQVFGNELRSEEVVEVPRESSDSENFGNIEEEETRIETKRYEDGLGEETEEKKEMDSEEDSDSEEKHEDDEETEEKTENSEDTEREEDEEKQVVEETEGDATEEEGESEGEEIEETDDEGIGEGEDERVDQEIEEAESE